MMDILDFAIQMEQDGEKLYKRFADENKDNSLGTVFLSLAKDEANHAKLVKKQKDGQRVELTDESATVDSVFGKNSEFQFAGKKPAQVDVYRAAQEKEKESIALYQKMAEELADTKGLTEFLIKQEEEHYQILDEIVKAVDRPNEWVESAEFGVREEY